MSKRPREEGDLVASHYNSRDEVSTKERRISPIIYLKNLNNCVKSLLISQFLSLQNCTQERSFQDGEVRAPVNYLAGTDKSRYPLIGVDSTCDRDGIWRSQKPSTDGIETIRTGARVLDLCGGKGGDLGKYLEAKLRYYVLADFADMSVEAARNRYNNIVRGGDSSRKFQFPAQFVAMNQCDHRLHHYLHKNITFDLVSCQFAFHYCFQSMDNARKMLQNVTDRLRPGGFFIGTMPDARLIVNKLREAKTNKFGNDIYYLNFDDPRKNPVPGTEQEFWSNVDFSIQEPFGIRYTFFLEDAVEDVPEYLVHFPTQCAIAAEYGLRPIMYENFQTYFANQMFPEYSKCSSLTKEQAIELMRIFTILDNTGSIPKDQWEGAGVYSVFAFQKVGTHILENGDKQETVCETKVDCVQAHYQYIPDPREAGKFHNLPMNTSPKEVKEEQIIKPK